MVTPFNLPSRLRLVSVAKRRPLHAVRPLGRLGSHVNRDGKAKNSYRTQAEARDAAQLAWTLHRAELSAYRCDLCHQWHIGGRGRDD